MHRRHVLEVVGASVVAPSLATRSTANGQPTQRPATSVPNLSVRVQGDTGEPGGQVQLGLGVTNDDTVPADDVDAYFRYEGGESGNTDYFGSDFTVVDHQDDGGEWYFEGWGWSTIAAGETKTPVVTLEVADDLPPGTYVFEAEVNDGTGTERDVDTGRVLIESAGQVDLELTIDGDTVRPGEVASLVFTLTNRGSARATGLDGVVRPPTAEWTFAGRPSGFDSLDPGESEQVTVDLTVPDDAEGSYVVEGEVADDAGNVTDDSATVHVQQATVSGSLVDVHGDPVGEATVRVFDVAERAELATATTDEEGRFEFEDVNPERGAETLLIARRPVSESVGESDLDQDWFTTRVYGGGPQPAFEFSEDLGTIPVDRQVLFPPGSPTDDSGEPLGQVTMWRFVGNPYQERYTGFTDPHDQVVRIEVTNVNRDGPLGDEDLADYRINRNNLYDLSSGTFSLTVPQDDVAVDYGEQSSLDLGGSVSVAGVDTALDIPEPADWHPRRTELPLYPSCTFLESQPYEALSRTDAERIDRIEEGFGRILGLVPVVGSVVSLMDTLDWALGERVDRQGDIAVPVGSTETNPNTHDTVVLGWRSDNSRVAGDEASVVYSVPLRIDDDVEGSISVVGQAEWRMTGDQPGGIQDGDGFFRWLVGFGPSGHIGGGASQ